MSFRIGLIAVIVSAGGAFADVMDDIAARGEMILGYRADAPPFSAIDDLGAPSGLAVSLCREAAQRVRAALDLDALPLRFEEVAASTRFAALAEGRIDLLCGPTTQTLARRSRLDFSVLYFIDASSVVFREGPTRSVEDLDGERVGYLAGTTTEAVVARLAKERGVAFRSHAYESHEDGLQALQTGDISAYFGDQAILRYQLGRMRPTIPLRFADEQFSFEPYALTMKRGETRLRREVDRALSEVFASGAIFTHIGASLGEVSLSDLALSVYQIVAIPD